jgi:hypothetical protein
MVNTFANLHTSCQSLEAIFNLNCNSWNFNNFNHLYIDPFVALNQVTCNYIILAPTRQRVNASLNYFPLLLLLQKSLNRMLVWYNDINSWLVRNRCPSVTSIDTDAAASMRLYSSQMQQVATREKTRLPEGICTVLLFSIGLCWQ